MKKPQFYRQCRLQKSISGSVVEQVSYIPAPYCVVGRVLKLRAEDGTWDDGWKVVSAGERQSATVVEERERDYTKIRSVTDI